MSAQCKVKSSAERAIKRAIVEQYPPLEEWIDEIIPKKAMVEAKAQNKVSIVVVDGEALFFSQRGGAWFPTLRLLHKCESRAMLRAPASCATDARACAAAPDPTMMPRMQVDKGAIKFVMSGANIMCRGLTSPGASMEDVPADTPVAITAEGKTHTLAVGITKLSSADMYVTRSAPPLLLCCQPSLPQGGTKSNC